MRLLVFISLIWSYSILSQQTFEICGDEQITHTYFADFTGPGTNTWYVNGTPYIGDDLTYTYTQPGAYDIVLRRDNVICYDEVTYQVLITQCSGIIYWIPNTFTPDGNEHNQTFGPIVTEGIDINGFSFTIYNRWGELIWQSTDLNARWDGTYNNTKTPDGVYTWKLVFNILGDDGKIQHTGYVTLIK